jgi:hypothetical protein
MGGGCSVAPRYAFRVRLLLGWPREKRRVVKLAACLTAMVAGAVLFASPAFAGKPSREFLPINDEQFSGVCSFTVQRTVLVNKSVLTTYSNGDQRITGTFKQRLTNLTTGKFIDLNSPGPVLLDFHADGSLTETDWGPQFARPPGQLLVTTGLLVWEFDSAGNFVSFTQRGGTSQDVCVLLG